MVYDYVVTLKNERAKYVNTVSVLIAVISAISFLNQQFRSGKSNFIFIVSFLLISGGLVWNWYRSVKKGKKGFYSRILLVAGVTWFAMPMLPWIGIPILLLALLEKQAKFDLEIGFTNERIVFNTFIKRKFLWTDFTNIVLKDNILTIDFKNNRLFQKETIDDDSDADEDEFNEYCRRKIMSERSVMSDDR